MTDRTDALWTHRGNKFVIGTIHGRMIEVEAQYNPREVARSAAASWHAHPNTSGRQSKAGDNYRWLEYGTTEPRSLTVELTFDGYESSTSIAPVVEKLESLTIPVDMRSRTISERRPQICVAVWGVQKLRCVVQSVATKLTMFHASGEPLRATCTVVLKEVDAVAMMDADGDRSDVERRDARITREHTRWRADPRGAKTKLNDRD
jgi:hypothetical protein